MHCSNGVQSQLPSVAWLALCVWQGACYACAMSTFDWITALLRSILVPQVEERMGNAVETLKALLDQCGPDSQDIAFIGKGKTGIRSILCSP